MKHLKKFFALAIAVSLVMAVVPLSLAEEAEKLNINTASQEDFLQLKNIGQKYAERIVAYREQNGPFEQTEDIMKVKGIGPKVFELNKERIMVEQPETEQQE